MYFFQALESKFWLYQKNIDLSHRRQQAQHQYFDSKRVLMQNTVPDLQCPFYHQYLQI